MTLEKKPREATPIPQEIASFWTLPSLRNFQCPPLGCGHFLELHNHHL